MHYIWMYWEGPQPEHIKLCIDSIRRKKGNLDLKILTPLTIKQFLPDLRFEWHILKKIAHKADYIRTRLVYEYGGMWIDCDMIALADIEPLFDFPDNFDYACQNISTSIGCFIARPKSKILKTIIEEQDKVLDTDHINFEWNDIGNQLLKKHGQDYPYYRWIEWTLDEIAGGRTSKLFSRYESIEENLSSNAVIFHLCNEEISKSIRLKIRDNRLMKSNTLISKIYRKSFDQPEQESKLPDFIENLFDLNYFEIFKKTKSTFINKLKL